MALSLIEQIAAQMAQPTLQPGYGVLRNTAQAPTAPAAAAPPPPPVPMPVQAPAVDPNAMKLQMAAALAGQFGEALNRPPQVDMTMPRGLSVENLMRLYAMKHGQQQLQTDAERYAGNRAEARRRDAMAMQRYQAEVARDEANRREDRTYKQWRDQTGDYQFGQQERRIYENAAENNKLARERLDADKAYKEAMLGLKGEATKAQVARALRGGSGGGSGSGGSGGGGGGPGYAGLKTAKQALDYYKGLGHQGNRLKEDMRLWSDATGIPLPAEAEKPTVAPVVGADEAVAAQQAQGGGLGGLFQWFVSPTKMNDVPNSSLALTEARLKAMQDKLSAVGGTGTIDPNAAAIPPLQPGVDRRIDADGFIYDKPPGQKAKLVGKVEK